MCGRYDFTAEDLGGLLEEVGGSLDAAKTGEIFPSDTVAVLAPGPDHPILTAMTWGFPRSKGGVVINARSETVTGKAMFRDSVLYRRCVIPTTGFYEWTHGPGARVKYRFRLEGEPVLYLAGCWNRFEEPDGSLRQRFVILTTAAGDSLLEEEEILSLFPEENATRRLIHDRMPVVLTREERDRWLSGRTDFAELFDRSRVRLQKQAVGR